MKMKKLNNKGFSLVEVIIAMTVVTIVTLTAISIIYSGADHTREGNAQSKAIYFVADAIEAFKAVDPDPSDNHADFYNALMMTGKDASGNIVCREDVTRIISPQAGFSDAFQIKGSNCRVYLNIAFIGPGIAESSSSLNYALSIKAVDSKGNVLIAYEGESAYVKASR